MLGCDADQRHAGLYGRRPPPELSLERVRFGRVGGGRLKARFRSRWLRFVDDLELAVETQAGVIHVRSASRLGRRDFGVNRKRVEEIRSLYRPR